MSLPGITHRIRNKVISATIPVGPVSCSTFISQPSIQLDYPNVGLTTVVLGTASSTVYCPIIAGQSHGTTLLRVSTDLGLSTLTHVQASSPFSVDLGTIARVFFWLLWLTGVKPFWSLLGLTLVGRSNCQRP